jgi:hypothetical protein
MKQEGRSRRPFPSAAGTPQSKFAFSCYGLSKSKSLSVVWHNSVARTRKRKTNASSKPFSSCRAFQLRIRLCGPDQIKLWKPLARDFEPDGDFSTGNESLHRRVNCRHLGALFLGANRRDIIEFQSEANLIPNLALRGLNLWRRGGDSARAS